MATFEKIANLDGATTGKNISAGLYRDADGNLFGAAQGGGSTGLGTVFKIAYNGGSGSYGAPQAIATFTGGANDGNTANGTLIADGAGNLYGTTQSGGPADRGTVYRLSYNSGTQAYDRTTLATFTAGAGPGTTGQTPTGRLIRDDQGNLYGTTNGDGPDGGGTVFKIAYNSGTNTYASTPSVVASFNVNGNGQSPAADLIVDGAGNLYGTTQQAGPNGGGTLFRIDYNSGTGTYANTPTTLVSFNGNADSNGQYGPYAATGRLAMDGAGNIYGTTQGGGTSNSGTVFKLAYNSGTGTYASTPTVIASFDGGAGGASPAGGVIVDAAGNIFGTASSGGSADGYGTVFKISYNAGTNTYGAIQTLHTFNGTDGAYPSQTLIADGQGNLYGTTYGGGNANGDGTVFRVSDAGFVCFTTGTRIRTERGEVPVEALRVGERVVTASGEARAIRWIGHRRLAPHHQPAPQTAHPVRIAAGAFGEGRPSRDLFVSPAHAIAIDVLGEVLIPACRLINGTTITQVEADEVTYWHVELDSHDILLAEGLPAESYLDCGNRRFFANADATDLLAAPDARPEGMLPFCRPFQETGPVVDLVRDRLQDRAVALGWRKVQEAFAGLHAVADGRVIRPDVDGFTARFVVPADAREVRLVSAASVPAHVVPSSTDDRRLGVALAAITIDDGLTGARHIALDDARLGEGLYGVSGGARWTDGSTVLSADLWDGCKGSFFLRVTLAGPALPRWIAPGKTAAVVNLPDRRQA